MSVRISHVCLKILKLITMKRIVIGIYIWLPYIFIYIFQLKNLTLKSKNFQSNFWIKYYMAKKKLLGGLKEIKQKISWTVNERARDENKSNSVITKSIYTVQVRWDRYTLYSQWGSHFLTSDAYACVMLSCC